MEENNENKKLPSTVDKTPRQLVEEEFINLGFTNENPDDLDLVTELLEIWRDPNIDDASYNYTPEQYILLNDPDVITVLNHCKEYYEPKKHLSKGDLRSILEQIALGKLSRQDYDFKNHEYITIEPSFTERIQAIKMLEENADNDNSASTVQFINNIVSPNFDPNSFKPNMDAPSAPPPDHYSLSLSDEPNQQVEQIGEEAE